VKKIHLYEVKLIDGRFYWGEILYKNEKGIRLRLANKQIIRLSYEEIMVIKDLGWKKAKNQ